MLENDEYGFSLIDDGLMDAVAMAVVEDTPDSDRVTILGGSYSGGVMRLVLVFTPERFAFGMDIVGPSSLETLLGTIPAY